MKFKLTSALSAGIREAYASAMGVYPEKKAEVEAFCAGVSETEADCLRFLYAFMSVNDIVSYDVEAIFAYVKSTLAMYERVDYAQDVPQELFLAYVLGCRVNNEYLDGSRGQLFDMLYPRICGKTMGEAALEVNYFCFEKATYTPTDDRTISPFGMMKAAKGRCGEESTFTVCALRAVGIPARQCYSPRWAHCDDNHAWVELWADGAWHYMGACEPEPVLDKGWFTAAASKAMLVHSKAYSRFLPGENVAGVTPIYSLINSTPVYGRCKTVTVRILEGGVPKAGVEVHFQLVNYSELYTIYHAPTDAEGQVRFTTGLGDLYIYAESQGRVVLHKLDVRQEKAVALELESGIRPADIPDTLTMDFEMNPPKEALETAPREADRQAHEARVQQCAGIRENYEKNFAQSGFLALAKGNQGEIRAFLEDPRFETEDKIQLLSTLREKDFVDTEAATLASYLESALPYKGKFPEEIYVSCLLAPRIADEMLLPVRGKIARALAGKDFTDGRQVWDYLRKKIRILPDYGADNWTADAYGMVRYGVGSEASFPVCFVEVCRSLGIPARLNPVTGQPEYVRMGEFAGVSDGEKAEAVIPLTLKNQSGQPLHYDSQFTLARWKNGAYQTLRYSGAVLEERLTWDLPQGSYRLLTAARQIDGAVSARTVYFNLTGDRTLPVTLCPDKTGEKLLRVPLPEGRPMEQGLLIFADPGMEPTEHLLRELLECREEYNAAGYKIRIILKKPSTNETLLRVLSELDNAEVCCEEDPDYLRRLRLAMEVGDERLPFAVAVDDQNRGLFAFANYNIRTAQTLLKIVKAGNAR